MNEFIVRWIPVSEELPEHRPENQGKKIIYCLVSLRSSPKTRRRDVKKVQRRLTKNGWDWSQRESSRITHWMPMLPNPCEEVLYGNET